MQNYELYRSNSRSLLKPYLWINSYREPLFWIGMFENFCTQNLKKLIINIYLIITTQQALRVSII